MRSTLPLPTPATPTAATPARTSTPPTPKSSPSRPTGLARCVGDVEGFLASYWGRAPLHRQGADPTGFADVLSLDDVDRFVSTSFARLPAFRLVRDGTPLDQGRYTRTARIGGQTVSGVGDPGRIYEEFRQGATIVLQGLQRSSEPVARFCRSLELELTSPVQANAYVTPPGARGLGVHYDTHDVFVLQVAGAKVWAVHEPVFEDPLPSQPWHAGRGEPGPAILEAELRAGDCLYVPRGFLHSAEAQEEMSAHLTVGVLCQTWFDVLRSVVDDMADRSAEERVAHVAELKLVLTSYLTVALPRS